MEREKAPGLAVLIGVGKDKPGRPKPKGNGKASPFGKLGLDEPEADIGIDADFKEAAVEAFPDLQGDTAKLSALQRAIQAAARAG